MPFKVGLIFESSVICAEILSSAFVLPEHLAGSLQPIEKYT